MISNIRKAFTELLKENKWMDQETKVFAREKVNTIFFLFDGLCIDLSISTLATFWIISF